MVVGFDRNINYYKIQYATLCIRENPGCLFLATNRDAVTHLTDAQEWAGNGSMVGAIVGSTKREPTVVGKPSGFMLENIARQFSLQVGRAWGLRGCGGAKRGQSVHACMRACVPTSHALAHHLYHFTNPPPANLCAPRSPTRSAW